MGETRGKPSPGKGWHHSVFPRFTSSSLTHIVRQELSACAFTCVDTMYSKQSSLRILYPLGELPRCTSRMKYSTPFLRWWQSCILEEALCETEGSSLRKKLSPWSTIGRWRQMPMKNILIVVKNLLASTGLVFQRLPYSNSSFNTLQNHGLNTSQNMLQYSPEK